MDARTKGLWIGSNDAATYARGTKADRAKVRRRIIKSSLSYAPFWEGYRDALRPRLDAFALAILEGRIKRTVNPHKLYRLVERCDDAATLAAR